MANKQSISKLINLTLKEICICGTGDSIITKLPSEGELKICETSSLNYPLHHFHYYDEKTGIEAGISILPAKIIGFDTKSLGYLIFQDLKKGDGIIVSQQVAHFIKLNKPDFSVDVFTIDAENNENENVVFVKALRWVC